jgi:hypothetical protein
MQFPIYATPLTKFSPLRGLPAISLTQDLPPGLDADVLVLGCGDVRNILFTFWCEEDNGEHQLKILIKSSGSPRRLDITCCDIEPAIIGLVLILIDG